ncbi:hypothetical protein CIB48_g11176 [Xylaria polymorpha]|nr:hypothetical protein CIB48_g11176 [Xylaria polymorpha]
MQPSRPQPRAPGSFSPIVPGSIGGPSSNNPNAAAAAHAATAAPSSRPMIRRIETSSTEESIALPKTRTPQTPVSLASPTFPNSPGRASPQNFSRPGRSANDTPSTRNASPLTLPPARAGHVRKHSQTPGLFEPSMPSMSTSNLSQVGMSPSPSTPSASQIAAQAAVRQQYQNQQQQQQPQHPSHQLQQHIRHRSQTVPFPGERST